MVTNIVFEGSFEVYDTMAAQKEDGTRICR